MYCIYSMRLITYDVMTRNKNVMVRLSDEEHQRLSVAANGQGATLAGYLRAAAHQQLAAGAGPAQHHATQQPLTAQRQPARALAVLIDADNAQATRLGPVLAEAAKHGIVTLRRIYGDWTSPQMSQWKQAIQSHAVHPVQQFPSVSGKNSTDMALAIDAVDLLHTADLGGICIVSSDSDFTRLATRIREQGLLAMGIGRRDTPKAFVTACEIFVYTDNLHRLEPAAPSRERTPAAGTAETRPERLGEVPEWDPNSGTAENRVDRHGHRRGRARPRGGRLGTTEPGREPATTDGPGIRPAQLRHARPPAIAAGEVTARPVSRSSGALIAHPMIRVLNDEQP